MTTYIPTEKDILEFLPKEGKPYWVNDPRYFVLHIEDPVKDQGCFYIAFVGDIPTNAGNGIYFLPIDGLYDEMYNLMIYTPHHKSNIETANEYAEFLILNADAMLKEIPQENDKSLLQFIKDAPFPVEIMNSGYLKTAIDKNKI